MKRFLLFFGESYYPSGGWKDFQGSFDTVHEARKAVKQERDSKTLFSFGIDWYYIVDLEFNTVHEFGWRDQISVL